MRKLLARSIENFNYLYDKSNDIKREASNTKWITKLLSQKRNRSLQKTGKCKKTKIPHTTQHRVWFQELRKGDQIFPNCWCYLYLLSVFSIALSVFFSTYDLKCLFRIFHHSFFKTSKFPSMNCQMFVTKFYSRNTFIWNMNLRIYNISGFTKLFFFLLSTSFVAYYFSQFEWRCIF